MRMSFARLARKTGLLLMLCALFISPAIPASEVAVTVYQHCGYEGYRVRLPPGNYSMGDLHARGVRNDDLSSIRVPRGYTVTIYEHDGFQGQYRTLTQSDECLINSGFNDKISSISVSQARRPSPPASHSFGVTVYQHCGYEGYGVHLPPGNYSLRDLRARGMRDNDVSSIRVSRGYAVKLFKSDGFQGRYHPLNRSDECLAGSGFDNKISSISVSEDRDPYPQEYHSFGVTVYEDCNYGGYGVHLPPGDYSLQDLRARDVRNDDVAAIRVSGGYQVTIYEHDGFQGRSRTLTRSDDCLLGSGLYDQVSSISVSQVQPHAFQGFDSFGVTVYEQCGYAGHAVQLPAGHFGLEDLRARDVRNDDVSSIKVPRGYEVTVYEHDGFQGRSLTLTENAQCLSNSGFTDNISSIAVSQVQAGSGGPVMTCGGSHSGP